jgi:hypothetical protein
VNNSKLIDKVHQAVNTMLYKKGYAATVDVLMEMGILSKEDYERWRFGRIDYLERVCKINLSKLSRIRREMFIQARRGDLKSSYTDYRKWGKGKNIRLRFSKYGDEQTEKLYSTHYYSDETIKSAKARMIEASAIKKEAKAANRAKQEEAIARKQAAKEAAANPTEVIMFEAEAANERLIPELSAVE